MTRAKITHTAASLNDAFEAQLERAVRNSADIAIDSAIDLCVDIARFSGSAADCVVALKTFKLRLAQRKDHPNAH